MVFRLFEGTYSEFMTLVVFCQKSRVVRSAWFACYLSTSVNLLGYLENCILLSQNLFLGCIYDRFRKCLYYLVYIEQNKERLSY